MKNWGRPKEEKSKVKFIRKNVRSISAWKKSIVKNYQIPQGLKTVIKKQPVTVIDKNCVSPGKMIVNVKKSRSLKRKILEFKKKIIEFKKDDSICLNSSTNQPSMNEHLISKISDISDETIFVKFYNVLGQPRELDGYDIKILVPRRFVTDLVVDYVLIDQQKNPTVRIRTTELPRTLRTTENNCIISSGVKVVVLPDSYNSPFFTSAAILDGVNSLLVVLQSFGGPLAIVPPSADNLAA